jgi:putative peptidoglycan lipid II flippase
MNGVAEPSRADDDRTRAVALPGTGLRLAQAAGEWLRSSVTRRILGAALTVGVVAILLKVAGAGRELAVAYYFGTADELDAFLIAYLAPSFIVSAPVAAVTAALMPTFVRVREEDEEQAARLVANIFVAVLIVLGAGCGLLALFAGTIVDLLGSGFSPAKAALTERLFYLLLPIVMLTGVARFWGTLINASRRFFLVAAAELVMPLLTVGLLLLLARDAGIYVLVGGVVGGAALELLLVLPGAWRLGLLCRPAWRGLDPATRIVIRQYLPTVLGTLMGSAMLMVDQSMAAMLAPGSVATLSYGAKLTALVLSLSAMPLGTAILPYLSELAARRQWTEIRRTYLGWVAVVVAAALPVAAILVLYAEPLVRLIFERGAFTAEHTATVSVVVACYALQLPFYLCGIIGARVLIALRHNGVIAVIGVVNFAVNIAGNLLFMWLFGLPGIALSTSAVYLVSSIILTWLALAYLRRESRVAASGPPERVPDRGSEPMAARDGSPSESPI